MRCDSCGKDAEVKAVIDGHVCDDCHTHGYTCCKRCLEVHPNKNVLFSMPIFSPMCTGCYDELTNKN